MCDYSLHGIKNRLAEEGEVLVVHRFYSRSMGLTSPEYLKPAEPIERPKGLMAALKSMFSTQYLRCAVCVPDGSQLTLHGISQALQYAHHLCATESVTFRQLSANAGNYRDAVEFKNGVKVLLQELEEGQRVEVRALSSEKSDLREQERPVYFYFGGRR
jgi:hypothetical protein